LVEKRKIDINALILLGFNVILNHY